MDAKELCMHLLHEDGATADTERGGYIRWKLSNRHVFLTPTKGHGRVVGWKNRLTKLRRILGQTHSKTADESTPTARATKRHKLRVKASPGLTYEQLETPPKTMTQKVISALGVSAIPQFKGVVSSFTRRIDETLVYTTPPEPQPMPTRSWPPLWHPTHPTIAERDSQLDKWAGRKAWTEAEIRFADMVYNLCGPEAYRLWVVLPHLEDHVTALKELESEILRIEEEIGERDRIIAAADTAKAEKDQLHEMLDAAKLALEPLQKGASLMRAGKGFSLQPKRTSATGAKKPRQYRAGSASGLNAVLVWLSNQPPGATFTTREVVQALGSTDEKKVGAAVANEASERGKGRIERVRKEGKICWWAITEAGRAAVRSAGVSLKESQTNGYTHHAAVLR